MIKEEVRSYSVFITDNGSEFETLEEAQSYETQQQINQIYWFIPQLEKNPNFKETLFSIFKKYLGEEDNIDRLFYFNKDFIGEEKVNDFLEELVKAWKKYKKEK